MVIFIKPTKRTCKMKKISFKIGRSFVGTILAASLLLGDFAPVAMATSESASQKTSSDVSYSALENKAAESYINVCPTDKNTCSPVSSVIKDYFDSNLQDTYGALVDVAELGKSDNLESFLSWLEFIYTQTEEAVMQNSSLSDKSYKLITGMQSAAAMATANRLKPNYYLSIGDSTLSGYGLDDYIHGENNGEGQVLGTEAPVLLARKLFGNDYKNHFTKLDKGGLRIDDLLVWLGEDEFADDFYYRYTMDGNAVEAETSYYQNLYESEIKKADLITLAIGGGNITNFLGQQIKQLQKGEPIYEMDWTRYFPDADVSKIHGFIDCMQEKLDGKVPKIQGVKAEELVPVLLESFLFGMVGYINNYHKVVDRIHEINPNAHIVIVGFFNPIGDMEIPAEATGGTVAIPLGKFISLLVESCNSANLVYALKNNDYTTYVSIHDTTTILDEQGKYDYESRFNGLISQTWLTHAGPKGHVYIANRIYDSITHDYTGKAFAAEALDTIDTLFTEAKKSANIVKSDIAELNAYCEETLEKIDQMCKDTVSDITCAIENAKSIGKCMIALVNEKLNDIVAKIRY